MRAQFNKGCKETIRTRISSVIFKKKFDQDKGIYLALG